jgi:hypothetical protein
MMYTPWEYCSLGYSSQEVVYSRYQQGQFHQVRQAFDMNLLNDCLALLGTMNWEAISVTTTNEAQEWHFKRLINPANGELTFPQY